MNLTKAIGLISRIVADIIVAYLMAIIAAGGDPMVLANIILRESSNDWHACFER